MSSSADLVECELNALFNTLNYSIIYNFKKEDLGSYTLISVLGEVSEQITLSATTYLIQNYQGIRPTWREFMRGRSCLTNCTSFYEAT